MRKYLLLAALCCPALLFGQTTTAGPGNPNSLSPVPSCTTYKVYVDVTTGTQYSATGSPCAWVQTALVQTNTYGCLDGYDHLPCTVASVKLTGQAANVSSTSILASVPAGIYRYACQTVVTQAATTSSTLPSCQLIYTDPTTNTSVFANAGGGSGGNAIGSNSTFGGTVDLKAAAAVNYQTASYASSGATPMQYKLILTLERVQ